MTTFEDLLAQARPVTRTVRLCLRGDLIAAREEAERDLAEARALDAQLNRVPEAPAAAERLTALEAEADEAAVEFKIKALSRKAWLALLDQYPPTEDDEAQGLEYNEGFVPAVIAACASEPAMTTEQAEQLLDVISTRQFMELWGAVMTANLGEDDLPKSLAATATLASSAPRSTTPQG